MKEINITQEKKELLIKDLCARLQHKVHCCVFKLNGDIKENDDVLYGVIGDNVMTLKSNKDECLMYYQIKPYLRPMYSMTDDELKEYLDMLNELDKLGLMHHEIITKVVDWLDKKMFDHRHLIPLGLALEDTKVMYS